MERGRAATRSTRSGLKSATTTVEHGWIPAGALYVGEQVYAADLTTGVIQAVQTVAEPQVMINLTVETVQTFAAASGRR